jgi:hypothetical protein
MRPPIDSPVILSLPCSYDLETPGPNGVVVLQL